MAPSDEIFNGLARSHAHLPGVINPTKASPGFQDIKLADPVPPWLKPGDLVMLAPANWRERMLALEDLWSAMKEPWVLGYSRKVAEAMKRLKELEG